nr:Chain P, INSULIN RECEPTOR, BETA-SUBUNIT [synthetic construct]
GNYSFYAL